MRSVARALLANKAYDIEFHGFLTNHVKHAVVALERLDAPEARIQEYWDQYTALTPYSLPLHKVEEDWNTIVPATRAQWSEWRGQKVHWQNQVAFMNQELERLNADTNRLVKEYAPDLLAGMAGALTHGIIHLGWAIDAQSPCMITEGLAYLNFCHVGFQNEAILERGKHADETPLDSYLRVAQSFERESLMTTWVERVKASYDETFHPELVEAGFQWHLSKLLHEPHPVATQLPTWLDEMAVDKAWESLYRAVTTIFLATRDGEGNGNFIVLHLITSLWGLEQTLGAMQPSEDIVRKALAQFYALTVVALSTAGFPSAESLEKARVDFPSDSSSDFDWAPTVKAAIAETEEHNQKLVYVTRELWKRYDHWKGFSEAAKSFTLTPNIGPAPFTGKE